MVQEKAKPVAACLQSIICFLGGEKEEVLRVTGEKLSSTHRKALFKFSCDAELCIRGQYSLTDL